MIMEIHGILAKSGFYISDPKDLRSISFDIISRRDNSLIIFKVLTNIDSFTKENARQLKLLAAFLEASPVLVGQRASNGRLEDGIIYLRHLISIITINTLYDTLIEGVFPSVFAAPGGFYVNIDNRFLQRIRLENRLSLGDLAKAIGVSRKAIQMYEQGMSATLDVGLAMEETLGVALITPLDPFTHNEKLTEYRETLENLEKAHGSVHRKLEMLGYQVIPLFRCPFDAFTRDDQILLLTGFPIPGKALVKKARIMANIASITEKHSVFFVNDYTSRKNIEGTPIIMREELERIASPEDILELVTDRKGRVRSH